MHKTDIVKYKAHVTSVFIILEIKYLDCHQAHMRSVRKKLRSELHGLIRGARLEHTPPRDGTYLREAKFLIVWIHFVQFFSGWGPKNLYIRKQSGALLNG